MLGPVGSRRATTGSKRPQVIKLETPASRCRGFDDALGTGIATREVVCERKSERERERSRVECGRYVA